MDKSEKNLDFLQSTQWLKFQDSVGRKTVNLEDESFSASLIEHILPIVGKYLYCPRGPQIGRKYKVESIKLKMRELIELAKKEKAGWIRIEPENDEILDLIKKNIQEKIVKAPHDMQPKEVFVLDIAKSQEQLLTEMKSKTRYNIKLAQKHGVAVSNSSLATVDKQRCVEAFLTLTKEMALRNGITAHPESYYRKMIESLPADMLSIYIAEYENQIIAANLVLSYGETTTYLHGASGNVHRNVMAPFLLQWQAILDAKQKGCTKYDFGGIKTHNAERGMHNDWEGITNFKLGFSPQTKPVVFPGTYDIIINPRAYALYRGLQKAKMFIKHIRK